MTEVTKIERHTSRQFQNVGGPVLPALYEAINSALADTGLLIQAAKDQKFLLTASGRYLLQLGEEKGFTLPANSGLDITSYKILVPIGVSEPKQVRATLQALLQAFYLTFRTNPSVDAQLLGPYSLLDGDDLEITTDVGTEKVSIVASKVSDLNNVSAAEIASILNNAQSLYKAESVKDRFSGKDFVRLTATTPGSGAFIQVTGGTLQNILQFPRIIETKDEAGTVWNITKLSQFTDEVRFTWDGAGTNPLVYLASTDDIVSIRGLQDVGLDTFSQLNGSYRIIDSGFDYFTIRSSSFSITSSSLTQLDPNNFVFTENTRNILFDKTEYAFVSEVEKDTVSLTVPAVPPLTRRFLKGSAHLHSNIHQVLDFTRTSVKINVTSEQDLPVADNLFVLNSAFEAPDFVRKRLKTLFRDTSVTEPTYAVEAGDQDFAVLPHTTIQLLPENPLYGEIGESDYLLDFGATRHGYRYGWGVTLGSLSGVANISAADLNKEHPISHETSETTAKIDLRDSSGNRLVFQGIDFGPMDVYRHSSLQTNESDFYMSFASAAAVSAAGLEPGMTFTLTPYIGVDVVPHLSNKLKYKKFSVSEIRGNEVDFTSGLGVGSDGLVTSASEGKRSGSFGGATGSHYLDKTSAFNQQKIFQDLSAIMLNHTPSNNPLYVGSYIFDPTGVQTNMTVSGAILDLSADIPQGDSLKTLFVTKPDGVKEFPQFGDLVIDYGNDRIEGPIEFFAVITNQNQIQIVIDPSYRFKKSHSAGAQVRFVHQRTQYVPTTNGQDFPFYITGTTDARNTLFILARNLVASGIRIDENVVLPDLRYVDQAIPPFD